MWDSGTWSERLGSPSEADAAIGFDLGLVVGLRAEVHLGLLDVAIEEPGKARQEVFASEYRRATLSRSSSCSWLVDSVHTGHSRSN